MKQRIEETNTSIQQRGEQLKREANKLFDKIVKSSGTTAVIETPSKQKESSLNQTLPYILCGVGVMVPIMAHTLRYSDQDPTPVVKITSILIGSGLCYLGYRLKQKQRIQGNSKTIPHNYASFDETRNEARKKVNEAIVKISDEWDSFMEQTKQQLQQYINELDVDIDRKANMKSKTYIYKRVTISQTSFFADMQRVKTLDELEECVDKYRTKTIEAIEETVKLQTGTYNEIPGL